MKVYVLRNGYLGVDLNRLVAMSTFASPGSKETPAKWVKVPIYCLYVEHSEGNFVFDLGCAPLSQKEHWPEHLNDIFSYEYKEEETLEKQLALIGVSPVDISKVILSHLHFDHMGNIGLFKHADIYVPKPDFMHAVSLVHLNQNPASYKSYVKSLIETPVKQYHLIEEDFEFCSGVQVISLPGHTPGILGLVLQLERDGTLIFPADASYLAENYGPPVKLPGNIYDSIAYVKSIEKIRKLQQQHNAKIMFSHDPECYNKMRKIPNYYS